MRVAITILALPTALVLDLARLGAPLKHANRQIHSWKSRRGGECWWIVLKPYLARRCSLRQAGRPAEGALQSMDHGGDRVYPGARLPEVAHEIVLRVGRRRRTVADAVPVRWRDRRRTRRLAGPGLVQLTQLHRSVVASRRPMGTVQPPDVLQLLRRRRSPDVAPLALVEPVADAPAVISTLAMAVAAGAAGAEGLHAVAAEG